jgi:outer membrane protein insertion porin family
MLRGRLGFIDEYADQNLQMPPYVRLRLGGGSTLDPLRGYDDYQVVPKENIRDTYTTSVVNGDTITTRTRVRYPGGRLATTYTLEQQFAIVNPLHGVIFADAGNVWNYARQYQPFVLRKSVGVGLRLEIPILGNVGFDYAYGFDRDDGARFVGHFLLGPASF